MPDDVLESVLRLVEEGRLSAEEAGPVLDALGRDAEARSEDPGPPGAPAASPRGGPGRAIRLEVLDAGRKVVNLRIPIELGRFALGRVPGLSDATAEQIREAIAAGITGPIIAVDDPSGDGVRIVIE